MADKPSPYDFAQACRDWRTAKLALITDPTIAALAEAAARLQEQLMAARSTHLEAAEAAAEIIHSYVIGVAESTEMHGVAARYKAGKRTPRWKEVAMALSPPQELIDQFTTTGEPSVTISLV